MSSCYDVDDEAVLIVSKLPQLKSLSLSYTDISDGAVAIICGGQVKRKDDKNKTVLIDYPVSKLWISVVSVNSIATFLAFESNDARAPVPCGHGY